MLYERPRSARRRENTDDAGVVAVALLSRGEALDSDTPETIGAESVIDPTAEVLVSGSAGGEAVSGISDSSGSAGFYGAFAKQHISDSNGRDKTVCTNAYTAASCLWGKGSNADNACICRGGGSTDTCQGSAEGSG